MALTLLTFGFKNGPPHDADLTLDVRFLPNPHYVDDLRPLTGLDSRVREYVEAGTQAGRVLRSPAAAAGVPRPRLRRRGQEPPDDRDRLHRRPPPLDHRRRPHPPRVGGPRRRRRAYEAPRRRAGLTRLRRRHAASSVARVQCKPRSLCPCLATPGVRQWGSSESVGSPSARLSGRPVTEISLVSCSTASPDVPPLDGERGRPLRVVKVDGRDDPWAALKDPPTDGVEWQ